MKVFIFTYREKDEGVGLVKNLFVKAGINDFEIVDLSYTNWDKKIDVGVAIGPTAAKYANSFATKLIRLPKTDKLTRAEGNDQARADAWKTVTDLQQQLALVATQSDKKEITLTGVQVDGVHTNFACTEEDLRFYAKMLKAFGADQIVIEKKLKD